MGLNPRSSTSIALVSPLELDTDSISPTFKQIVAVCQRVSEPLCERLAF